ncbi:MAG: ClbS/DfsB family four-helix bundle protein [Planctomycetota bacterium]
MRVRSKAELLAAIEENHTELWALIDAVPARLRTAPGVWGDDWSVKDLVLHTTAWEQLFLGWYHAGERGETVHTPAEGYRWNETSRLNRDLQKRLARTSWKRAIEDFHSSYDEILRVARGVDEEALLGKGVRAWTRSTTIGAYLASNTASHYRTESKILRRWARSRDTAGA